MDFLFGLFKSPPCPSNMKPEVNQLINELLTIGKRDDFLSERPGSPFNAQCRHQRGRLIGERLNEIGGYALMEYAQRRVSRKLGVELGAHLEYSWAGIGNWLP